MIHHTCDRCCRIIDPDTDTRYEVRIDIQTTTDLAADEVCEDDRDHLNELSELIEQHADEVVEEVVAGAYEDHRYDLCAECYAAFQRNPVGREASVQLGFSEN